MKKFNEIVIPQIGSLPDNRNKVETYTRTTNNYFTMLGTDGIGEPEDHYEALEILKHANQGDLFVCTFSSSPGGSYSGILAWKNALESTEARTIAILEGDLASAGTIIPMYFDECHVTPFTTFMCHSANFGISRNTALNVEANAMFQAKIVKRFLRDAYKGFLEESEILKILDGAELYFDEFEIEERLEKRKKIMMCDVTEEQPESPCGLCQECLIEAESLKRVEEIMNSPPAKKAPAKKQASPTKKATKA